jgi:hypothetical protein
MPQDQPTGSPAPSTRGPWWCPAAASLLGVLLMTGAQQPPAYPPQPPPAGSQPAGYPPQAGMTTGPALGNPAESPAAQLINEARLSFGRVRDYVGTMVKQERVGGQLLPEQAIAIRARTQPFSVYLKWQAPQNMVGQEACFVAGKNNNQMRAKSAGLLGGVGFVSLDPRDPKAMKGNRHAITEAGIGNLIERVAAAHAQESRLPPSQVTTRYGEYLFQQRPCVRMEAVHLVNNGQFYCYRCVVYFDKETRLPVRFEAYDWPAAGGAPGGELLECYSYIDLKFNVGLTDAAFNY